MNKILLFLIATFFAFFSDADAQVPLVKDHTATHQKTAIKAKNAVRKTKSARPRRVAPPMITEQPEGELRLYQANYDYVNTGSFTTENGTEQFSEKVVFNGDKVYFQGLFTGEGYYWVEGTLNENRDKITVPLGQYIHWSEEDNYGKVIGWGKTYVTSEINDNEYDDYSVNQNFDASKTEATFSFDPTTGVITLDGSSGDLTAEYPDNYVAEGLFLYWSDDNILIELAFNYKMVPTITTATVPANPLVDNWYDSGSENGFSRLYFTLPTTNVDGHPIELECLSYRIYTDDDQLFTFPAEDYTYDLTEDITEVPYSLYSNAVDFKKSYVYFYRTNAEGYEPLFKWRIGIQAVYTIDGETNVSDIVYLYIPTVPANPTADGWYDCGDESGFSRLYFTLPATDANGYPLTNECLSYRIYTDNDQLFTFPAKDYKFDLTEDITEVPYSLYSKAVDFKKSFVYFYRTNAEGFEPLFDWRIGIQAVYTIDGVTNESEIAYLYHELPISLVDNGENTETIEEKDGENVAVILAGRTLYKDGNWNTLCLPFSLTAEEIDESPLAGADIRRMASGTVTGHHVDLTFEPADAIEAGTPYLIKWEGGSNLVSPTFLGVTIDKTMNNFTSTDGNVQFIGYYDPFTVSPDDNPRIHYLSDDNKLTYSAKERTLNAFRAYFIFTATETGANDFTFDINFGDGTDAITGVESAPKADADTWFTLDGRKLNGKPTKKGIYVTNGRKVIIQ